MISAETIVFLGIFLTICLRIGIVSYIEAANFQIGTYLLYLASAGPLVLLFATYGAVGAVQFMLEKRRKKKALYVGPTAVFAVDR